MRTAGWIGALGIGVLAACGGAPEDAIHACGSSVCDARELCVHQYVEDGLTTGESFLCVADCEGGGQCAASDTAIKTCCPAQWGTGSLRNAGCVASADSVHLVSTSQTLSCGYAFP